MNLELKEFRDIVENGISKDRDNEVPSLEPPSEAIRSKMNNRNHLDFNVIHLNRRK